MIEKIRIVHYLNQFFAQVGGEEGRHRSRIQRGTHRARSCAAAGIGREW